MSCLINLGFGYAWSQEVRILSGVIKNPKTHEHSFTMQFECVEELGDAFALSLAYLNEGHFSNHHRDGVAGQLWINRDVFNRRLSLVAGLGPYFYCDTTSDSTADYLNDHEFGVVNSFGSERSLPLNIEYRRKIWRHIEWTVAGLYEGYNAKINRYGPITQLWIVKAFFNDRFALGAGAGCYYALDRKQDAPYNETFFAGIISVTACYQFHPHWRVRTTFNRILSDHDRDSDVLPCGIGYQF